MPNVSVLKLNWEHPNPEVTWLVLCLPPTHRYNSFINSAVGGESWDDQPLPPEYRMCQHVGMWICRALTTVGYLRSKVNDDRESAAVVSVVGQRWAQARRPALTGVWATLLMEGCGTEVLMAGREQILVQHVTHFWGIGHWVGKEQVDIMSHIRTIH